jgi:hypothetical protein
MSATLMQLDRQLTDLCHQFQGSGPHEREVFIPTPEALADLSRQAEALRVAIAAAGEDSIWQGHLLEVVDALEFRLLEDVRYPYRFLGTMNVNDLIAQDPRPAAERGQIIAARLSRAADLFPVLLKLLERLPAQRLDQVREYAEALVRVLADAEPVAVAWGQPGLAQLLASAQAEARRFVTALDAGVQRHDLLADFPFDVTLRRGYGLELSELLSWVDAEIERREAELAALAERIHPGMSPAAILDAELPAYPAPDLMFQPMREYLGTARAAAQRYITLPEGEHCEVSDVPEQLKRSYPWGGYSGDDILTGSLGGKVFLNSSNYQAVTRGWLLMMALHECYPGHHAQQVKIAAAKLPESFKIGGFRMAKAVPLTEGIAHRSEELFQDLFPDRAFPLFVKLRQLHTAVRIKAEISLHYLGRPRAEAVDLYVKHLGFSRQSADGQVAYSEIWPGYFSCYYNGHKRLNALKAKYGVSEQAFMELTFGCGYVSLETVEKLLALPEAARAAYLDGRAFGL